MQPLHLRCICTLLALAGVCGCQHIPARPLDLQASYDAIAQRDLAVQPIQDYAAALTAAHGDAAAPFDVADGLSLLEAKAIALWYNADLRIARLEAERAGALADTAGRWADPQLGLEGGRKWFDGDLDPAWIGSASVSITIPISGRAGAEKRARTLEHEAAVLAVAESEWRTQIAVEEAWIRWSECVERLRLLDDHIALVGPFMDTARELAQAGELDTGTSRLFVIERGRKLALRDATVFEEPQLRAKVMNLLGLLPDTPVELVPELSTSGDAQPALSGAAAINHPAVARLRAEYDAAEARLRLELRKQYPDLTLSPTFDQGGDDSSVVVGFGFPIPAWNANREGIAEAVAQRALARARVEAELQQVSMEIATAEAGLSGARARRERLMNEVAAEVDHQISESRNLIRSGELDMGSLFQAITQAYDVKQELLQTVMGERIALSMVSALANPAPLAVDAENSAE